MLDDWEGLLILIVLLFPIAAIVAAVMAFAAHGRLRTLEQRLLRLERRLDALAGAVTTIAPQPQAPAPSARIPTPEPPAPARPAESAVAAPPERPATPAAPPTPRERAAVPPTPSAPARPAMGFEERFGTQWMVWIGGLALALGGFFAVRYSIEQGLIGPGVRVTLGALLALASVAMGEWTRRSERVSGFAGPLSADIPSILTAAGTSIAYADAYAAYALYGFLSPPAAFVVLGLVALATLAAALLHGPMLAGLGLVGAYMTPLLVASDHPDYWSLYIYLAVVTAAAFALARMRLWRWLAVTAVIFAFVWTLPGVGDAGAVSAHAFYLAVVYGLASALLVSGLFFGPPAKPSEIDWISSGALAVFVAAATILAVATRQDPLALAAFAMLTVATCAIAWRSQAAVAAVPAAAVLAALVMAHWAVEPVLEHLIAPAGPVAGAVPEPENVRFGWHLVLGGGLAALFAGTGFLAQGRSEQPLPPILWSVSAVFAPIAILLALYYRIAGFDRSVPFAAVALLLAALAAYATEELGRRPPRPGLAASGAIFATGAVASLGFALTMALDKGWLTIGLALMVPGIAWVSEKRPFPALRFLAAAVAALVVARIGYEPRIVGADVGTAPIFNWLLYGYGIPALAFWVAGHRMRRRADDAPVRVVDTAAILFTVLLVFLEIRHAINGGNVYRSTAGLAEAGLQASASLALAIGFERLRLRTQSVVHDIAALAVGAVALVWIVLGLGLIDNPAVTGQAVGGPFVNLILLAYALPALLAAILALITRQARPQPYSVVWAIAAVALGLFYLTLEIRRLFHGAVLTAGATTAAEQYAYSSVWLAYGVALLAAGIALRSQPARIASAAIVVLTVFKVFLVDMSNLTGLYQALSFIGLGIVLLGIGWFYQHLLFPRRAGA